MISVVSVIDISLYLRHDFIFYSVSFGAFVGQRIADIDFYFFLFFFFDLTGFVEAPVGERENIVWVKVL